MSQRYSMLFSDFIVEQNQEKLQAIGNNKVLSAMAEKFVPQTLGNPVILLDPVEDRAIPQYQVEITLTDWVSYFGGAPMYAILAQLYSASFKVNEHKIPIPIWAGIVQCNVPSSSKEVVIELIRNSGLSASDYKIGRIWKPEVDSEF